MILSFESATRINFQKSCLSTPIKPVHSFTVRNHAYPPFICVIKSVVRQCLRLPDNVQFIRSVDVYMLQTQSCDRCGKTQLSYLLIQIEKMSALPLMSPTQCKPRNCGSILHVSKRFINHFSEVSSPTLGTTQPSIQSLPADSPPARPNCEVDTSPSASVQVKNESSCKSIPP